MTDTDTRGRSGQDPQKQSRREGIPLGRIAGAIALVVFGWLAVVVALTFGSAPGKSMAIVGPPSQALAAIVSVAVLALWNMVVTPLL